MSATTYDEAIGEIVDILNEPKKNIRVLVECLDCYTWFDFYAETQSDLETRLTNVAASILNHECTGGKK